MGARFLSLTDLLNIYTRSRTLFPDRAMTLPSVEKFPMLANSVNELHVAKRHGVRSRTRNELCITLLGIGSSEVSGLYRVAAE